jgi:hypothetical protein
VGPGEKDVADTEENQYNFDREHKSCEKQQITHKHQNPTAYASMLVIHENLFAGS